MITDWRFVLFSIVFFCLTAWFSYRLYSTDDYDVRMGNNIAAVISFFVAIVFFFVGFSK